MSIDLRNLSAKELGALIAKAKEQQTKLAKRTPIATVRGKITKFAYMGIHRVDTGLGPRVD